MSTSVSLSMGVDTTRKGGAAYMQPEPASTGQPATAKHGRLRQFAEVSEQFNPSDPLHLEQLRQYQEDRRLPNALKLIPQLLKPFESLLRRAMMQELEAVAGNTAARSITPTNQQALQGCRSKPVSEPRALHRIMKRTAFPQRP